MKKEKLKEKRMKKKKKESKSKLRVQINVPNIEHINERLELHIEDVEKDGIEIITKKQD